MTFPRRFDIGRGTTRMSVRPGAGGVVLAQFSTALGEAIELALQPDQVAHLRDQLDAALAARGGYEDRTMAAGAATPEQ